MGKLLLSSNFIFFLSCLSKLCSVSRSQWWADSINPDIPIYASLPWFVWSISLSCRPSSSCQCVELKCFSLSFFNAIHINHLQIMIYYFCILSTLWHILQWFNHFFVNLAWSGRYHKIPPIYILHKTFAISKFRRQSLVGLTQFSKLPLAPPSPNLLGIKCIFWIMKFNFCF